MGVASVIFEPHPHNFANQCNFSRCINDVYMTSWYLCLFQIPKNPQEASFPVLESSLDNRTYTLCSRWPLIPYKSCCLIENLIFQFKTNLLDTLFSFKSMCLFTAASMKISLKNCFCKTILHYDHTAESEKTK